MKKFYLFFFIVFLFSEINAQSGVTRYICPIAGTGINYKQPSALAIDQSNNVWIGFNSPVAGSYQLLRFNGTNWDTFPHVPGEKVHALAVDASNLLWIATDSGLVSFNGNTFTAYTTQNSNLPSDKILCLAYGSGSVYAGTDRGLSVFTNGNFINYNHANNGLSHDTIVSIAYENPNAVWLGNPYGLEKFYGSGFSFWYNLGGIASDQVNCIYIDQPGNKWLGTNAHGVLKFDNLNFYTMQQLFNQYEIIGGTWPKTTYSICKGPNGGVSFTLPNMGYPEQGIVEISGNQHTFYTSVGSPTGNSHSIFLHDINTNRIFYVISGNFWPGAMVLYSFDAAQYFGALNIQQTNSEYLDINNVAALITANSDYGTDGATTKYFLPKGQNTSPLGRASVWMGGYVNGALKMAAMTYRQNGRDFWPGPLDTTIATEDTVTALSYNKVWKINRFDIANFIYNWNNGRVQNGTYIVPPPILSWPAHGAGNQPHNLAPYVDVNNNGLYDPIHDGDYPLIKGDQMIWWVFNDMLKHGETTAAPMGIQVNASAYAFTCPNIADSNKVLNNTTFYNYKITNYTPNKIDSFFVSPWVDADLGWYLDDYIGCDVMNNFGFAYNGDNYDDDGNGMIGYHTNLPAFSCNILNGPPADPNDGIDNDNNGIIDGPNEKCLMYSFDYYTLTGNPLIGNPASTGNGIQYRNFMHGIWKDGTPITYGADGTVQSNPKCRHVYPGTSDPYGISMGGSIANPMLPAVSNWTEYSAGNVKGDRRFIIGVGPFTMLSGKTYEVDYALVFSQDSATCASDSICPISVAQNDNARVRRWFNNNSFPSCLSLQGVGIKNNASINTDVKFYPNPTASTLYVDFTGSVQCAIIEVYDLLGNVVWAGTFRDGINHAVIPVSGIANGVYLVKMNLDGTMITKKFIKE